MYMLGIGGSNLSRTVFFLIILLKSALQMFLLQIWGWATRAWDWGKGSFIWFPSWKNMIEENIYLFKSVWLIYWLNDGQEGAEEDLENNANEDIPGDLVEGEDKEEPEPVERPRKTSKYMTKYERARILGTRALQIRFSSFFVWPNCLNFTLIKLGGFHNVSPFWAVWMHLWWSSWRVKLIHLRLDSLTTMLDDILKADPFILLID